MRSSHIILADSGFWMALFDSRDEHHLEAATLPIDFDRVAVLVPWPSLYETLNSRFVKDPRRLAALRVVLARRNVVLVDDHPYREDAYIDLEMAGSARPLSLVDRVIRLLLADPSLRVGAVVTFNAADFFDVCRTHSIEIVPSL